MAVFNKGEGRRKLYTVYPPPADEQGIQQRSKEDAEGAEAA